MLSTPHHTTFDWARAIERNSDALKIIVAALVAMLGRAGGATVEALPERVYRAVLRVLGPAESAVRRLVVIAARGLVVKSAPTRPMPKLPMGTGRGSRPGFRLFDPVMTFASCYWKPGPKIVPRIHAFDYDPRVAAIWASRRPATPPPDDSARTRRLIHRLQTVKSALDDLPRQARRLARWRMKRAQDPIHKFKLPLRPGRPPGYRKKKDHEVDDILTECHGLARDALKVDTS